MARPRTPKIPKAPRIESVPEDFLRYSDLPTEFLNNFRKNITSSVAFVKKDGSVRTMAFRKRLLSYNDLRSTDSKSEKETNILPNNNMFRGYDVNLYNKALAEYNGDSVKASSKAYRQFFLDNVLAIMSGGKVYDFREKNKVMERFGPEVYNSLSSSMINALKNDIQSAQSESGETLQENFKNMKKKINLNQFKSLVKDIINEEKTNLSKNKVVRITESQLRSQVRKMLREDVMGDNLRKQVEATFKTNLLNYGMYYYFQGKKLVPIQGGAGSTKHQVLDLGFKVDGNKIIAFVGKDENSSPNNDKLSIDVNDTGAKEKLIGFFDKWKSQFKPI